MQESNACRGLFNTRSFFLDELVEGVLDFYQSAIPHASATVSPETAVDRSGAGIAARPDMSSRDLLVGHLDP